MAMNPMKLWFLNRYGTLWTASKQLTIDKSAFSLVVNYHRPPTELESQKLRAAMGPYYYRKFFSKPKAEQIKGTEAING